MLTCTAWIAGGAGDPNSGSAVINEVIRSLGIAMKKGWKPMRTIVFASWDGEEYGLVGSTEWVEEYLPWLAGSAVAYLNVDVGTRGPVFIASASPLLNRALGHATSLVQSPNQTVKGQTVYDVWNKHISTMGSGSDFTAFQDFAGIPSLDMGFSYGPGSPVYHYHSNYDSFYWMDKFGDSHWIYHATMAKVWSVLAVHLSESPVIPLNTTDYARGLAGYMSRASEKAQRAKNNETAAPFPGIDAALADLHVAAAEFDVHAAHLAEQAAHLPPWWKLWQRLALWRRIRRVNLKLKMFEREFLHQPGLDSRPWFKHVVFAPGLWTGYAGETFPGLIEGIDAGDWESVERWSLIVEALVRNAAKLLRGH